MGLSDEVLKFNLHHADKSLIIIFFKALQPSQLNSLAYPPPAKEEIPLPKLIDAKLLQLLKEWVPTTETLSGSTTFTNFLHPLKALVPMLVIFSPIWTDVSISHPLKQSFPISPSTLSGILKVFRLLQDLKALSPMLFIPSGISKITALEL